MSDSKAKTASQILFQNSLAEVVRKLRSSKKSEKETIHECIQDIKSEITSKVQMVKVTAVVKLTYFTMLGYPADYGAFNVVEVMADQNFQNKRAGYIAASLTFNEQTDVLPLCTALLKRDLASPNMFEVGLALYCLASVCTPDLARDLVSDVVNLLQHPKPYIRKKAVLCLYKLFLQYPDALRPTYPKLKDMIEDSDKSETDPAVRGAIVGILCEMARRNPSNFLSLAVPFFSLLSSIHNNWSLIKVVKVFGYFAPLEPRLGKKLAEPITNLINSTSAKSVQYECILAVANGMSKVSSVTKLAVDKMKLFVEDRDQNLKYLGLDAMSRVMIENPKMLLDQRDTILKCLVDNDTTIRSKALEILRGVTTPKNLVSTVNSMYDGCVRTPPDEDWSNLVIETIIETVRHDDYARVTDFEWYCGVLIDLALIDLSHFRHGALIESEIVTILTRVNAIRPYGVESLAVLLSNSTLLGCDTSRSSQWRILKAAAFACGEYPHWIVNPNAAVECLISEKIASMPVELQVLCIGAAGKIYSHAVHPCDRHVNLVEGEEEEEPLEKPDAEALHEVLYPTEVAEGSIVDFRGLLLFCHSIYPDVQEKAQFVHYLATNKPACAHVFYQRDLLAVAEGAQKAVTPPADLDLDTPFCEDIPALLPDSSESDSTDGDDDGSDGELTAEMVRRKDRQRKEQVAAFYIPEGGDDEDALPPVTKLDSKEEVSPSGKRLALGRKAGKKTHTINRTMAKPENYVASADRGATGRRSFSPEEDEATRRLRAIDVTQALRPDEKLPEAVTYANLLNKSAREATEEMRRAEAALRLEPVVLHEDKSIRVSTQVLDCKGKKDGLHLGISITMTNLTASSSIYDVAVSRKAHCFVLDDEGVPQHTANADGEQIPVLAEAGVLAPAVVPESSDKKDKKSKKGAEPEAPEEEVPVDTTTPFNLCDKLKPGAHGSLECVLILASLPTTFSLVPLLLDVTFTREKKSTQMQLSFPLVYKYFAAMLNTDSVPTVAEYHDSVLTTHLASEDTSVISATIPLFPLPPAVASASTAVEGDADGKKKKKKSKDDDICDPTKWSASEMDDKKKEVLLFALPALKAQLRLHTMDVFKDSTTLYGQVVGRKSHVNKAHMAFLLQDAIVEMEMPAAGEEPASVARLPALSVSAKGINPGMLEAAVQEIARILTEEGKKLCGPSAEEAASTGRTKKSKK